MKNILAIAVLGAALLHLGYSILSQPERPARSEVLLGMTDEFVQTVPGTPTDEWVFRCNRVWRTNDSTIQVFEYDRMKNRTLRSTFVDDDLVSVDLFYWQTAYIRGTAESRAFHVPVPTERSSSDIPRMLRNRM